MSPPSSSPAPDSAALLARLDILRGLDPGAFVVTPVRDTAPDSDQLLVIEGLGEALVARPPAPVPEDDAPPAAGPAILARRHDEARALALAGPLGLAPPTLHYDPEDGFWVMPALSGIRLDNETLRDGDRLAKVAIALRRLHISGMTVAWHRDPFETLQISGACIGNAPPGLPADGLHAITDVARECRVALIGTAPDPAPCLNAPWPSAYLDTGSRVLLLDWRAAAMSDPHHDLACLCEAQNLGGDQEGRLLRAYFGTDRGRGQDRVRVFRLLAAQASLMDGLGAMRADNADAAPPHQAHLIDRMARCRAIIESSAWNQAMERLMARASLSPLPKGATRADPDS